MQAWAESFYKSQQWVNVRNAYAQSQHYLCESCLEVGLYTPGEIVHHKIFLTRENITNPNIALSFDNLELLCRKCHGMRHKNPKRRYIVDETGAIIAK